MIPKYTAGYNKPQSPSFKGIYRHISTDQIIKNSPLLAITSISAYLPKMHESDYLMTLLQQLKAIPKETWQLSYNFLNGRAVHSKTDPELRYIHSCPNGEDELQIHSFKPFHEMAIISVDKDTDEAVKPLYRQLFDFFANLQVQKSS